MWDGLSPMWAGLFFLLVEKDIYYHFGIIVIIQFLSFILLICLNLETPRWLLLNGRREDAIKTLNFIAWFNGADPLP